MTPGPELRILIVEDDPETARLVERRLACYRAARFASATAPDLETALARIESDRYDAVLLDLSLPDSNAESTIGFMSGLSRHLPIVVSTGLDDDELALRASGLGVQDFLVKETLVSRRLPRTLLAAIQRHAWARRSERAAQAAAISGRSARA